MKFNRNSTRSSSYTYANTRDVYCIWLFYSNNQLQCSSESAFNTLAGQCFSCFPSFYFSFSLSAYPSNEHAFMQFFALTAFVYSFFTYLRQNKNVKHSMQLPRHNKTTIYAQHYGIMMTFPFDFCTNWAYIDLLNFHHLYDKKLCAATAEMPTWDVFKWRQRWWSSNQFTNVDKNQENSQSRCDHGTLQPFSFTISLNFRRQWNSLSLNDNGYRFTFLIRHRRIIWFI